ncbi:AMP-binding protein [Zobellia galactanivorans]|uniref:AMP-binding protein n=1 Tax=Zobellia galactanivorans (strain DSM 12802 / CCUG 47099 / CIP 106680 / NCIMB 13871 / Dsij) TaxID=63186 RepID=UPI0026E33AB3|nr:AMP-binding protein [Zobellia galactanivorans]MDO6807744.1 AMP-binding protein [Zobellia galactanivorans]
MQTYKTLHHQFKLNGCSYSKEELKEVAYSLVKEGEAYEQAIGDFLIDWLNDAPSLTVHTSGSTGKPKPISLQKQHMVNSARATGAFFELQPGDTALLCLPASYIAGKMMLVRAMVLGLSLDCVHPSSKPLTETSASYDFIAMVPLQFENSLNELDGVKKLIVGGAPVSYKLKQSFLKAAQRTKVYETYGMTETITHIAVKPLLAELIESNIDLDVFTTLADVSVTTDERGCLVIDAPLVSNETIHTNDMVRLTSEKTFKWLGRLDNVINSGGVKLFPEQIEAKLASIMENRFFVAALPDEVLGQKLVLLVEGVQETAQLRNKIANLTSLKKFELPKEIFTVEAFVETSSGKIKRKATLNKVAL